MARIVFTTLVVLACTVLCHAYRYVGCYEDTSSSRILGGTMTTLSTMTIETCVQTCSRDGDYYAGLENGNRCFCGKYLKPYPKLADSACSLNCVGDPILPLPAINHTCGDLLKISVYTTNGVSAQEEERDADDDDDDYYDKDDYDDEGEEEKEEKYDEDDKDAKKRKRVGHSETRRKMILNSVIWNWPWAVCADNKDCVTCASSSSWFGSCRWCYISNACHAYASVNNPCYSAEDIKEPSQCWTSREKYQPRTAFNSTLLSAIAYADYPKVCMRAIFPDEMVFQIKAVIGRKCENLLFEYKECFAYTAVSHTMKVILLAYRGTTSTRQLVDELFSSALFLKPFKSGGKVQSYFDNANEKLYPCVEASVRDLVNQYPEYEVVVTGHSLGAALASMASVLLSYNNVVHESKISLYAFGMPRVGDHTYAYNHDKLVRNSYRVVHYKDIVSHLPPITSLYHHPQEIFYYKSEMHTTSSYTECLQYEDGSCSNQLYLPLGIDDHKSYFNIHLGSHCATITQRRRKRADESSDMSHLFTDETCKCINIEDIPAQTVG